MPSFAITVGPPSQWYPKVSYARASEEFLVVWQNRPGNNNNSISAQRISADMSGFPGRVCQVVEKSDRSSGAFSYATFLTT
jgi:hypothetical protein